eukprot:8826479-Alexandrium_andersonii.AAC.1
MNAELIDRHLEFINLHWEGGRAACDPALDGLSWDMLGPKLDSRSGGSANGGVEPAHRDSSA